MAPLVLVVLSPLNMMAIDLILGASFDRMKSDIAHSSGFLLLLFAYPLMLVLGVPAYLLAAKAKVANAWSAILAGALAANAPMLIPIAIDPRAELRWLAANPALPAYLADLGILGGAVGLTFWLVVARLSKTAA